jgi:hypothetical protein
VRHETANKWLFFPILLVALTQVAAAQSLPPTTLLIDYDNVVNYNYDTFDILKFATSTGIAPNILQPAFTNGVGIGDVVAVNGQPAKGLVVYRYEKLAATTIQIPGSSIADVTRQGWITYAVEILSADGTPIGTLMAQGFAGGAAPPGSSSLQNAANMTIIGGTGIFAGARGTGGNAARPGATGPRLASIVEDPAMRRKNGGGTWRVMFNINPVAAPAGIVTGLTFSSPTVKSGDSYTATVTGTNLTDKTYFDVTFRSPGSNVDIEVFNWQQGVTASHTVPAGVLAGTWAITAIRFHENALDHFSGAYVSMSVPLTVAPDK